MRITYDPDADALYIELKKTQAADNTDLQEGVTADLDKDGNIIGIEILDAKRRYGEATLRRVTFERFADERPHKAAVPS